jgi:hypothetical protein
MVATLDELFVLPSKLARPETCGIQLLTLLKTLLSVRMGRKEGGVGIFLGSSSRHSPRRAPALCRSSVGNRRLAAIGPLGVVFSHARPNGLQVAKSGTAQPSRIPAASGVNGRVGSRQSKRRRGQGDEDTAEQENVRGSDGLSSSM